MVNTHGLSSSKSSRHQQRHAMLNDIIWHAIKLAHVLALKEPTGLDQQGGKSPDGATLIPWVRGKPMAWDVMVLETFPDSHISETSEEAGATAKFDAANINRKYAELFSK